MPARMILLSLAAACLVVGPTPALAQKLATYHCRDGGDFVASFFPGGRRLSAKVDGRNILLTRRLSLSGTRYVSGDITIRVKGQTATLTRGRRSTDCAAD
jgi:membrane-bound inhibitor of C-type lysozyme